MGIEYMKRIFGICLIILNFTLLANAQNWPIKIDNIESRIGAIASTDIESFIKTFPKGWFSGVKSIIFIPEYKMIDEKLEGFGTFTRSSREIGILNSARGFHPILILNAISHEGAHANDWISCIDLTLAEKEELRENILLRIRSPNRLKRSYVEHLEERGISTEYVAEEYWAEIASRYFINPDGLAPEDVIIVRRRILELDPEYNEITAATERGELINKIFDNITKQYLRDTKALK